MVEFEITGRSLPTRRFDRLGLAASIFDGRWTMTIVMLKIDLGKTACNAVGLDAEGRVVPPNWLEPAGALLFVAASRRSGNPQQGRDSRIA